MKFDFSKSIETDFRNKLQLQIGILMKNVLYLTHQVDFIRKEIVKMTVDKDLQTQVDQYFEDDTKDIPEETKDLD